MEDKELQAEIAKANSFGDQPPTFSAKEITFPFWLANKDAILAAAKDGRIITE